MNMKTSPIEYIPVFLSMLFALNYLTQTVQCETKRNILFVMADDLRPELEVYIDKNKFPEFNSAINTPRIAEFAQKSSVFQRAYVQLAVCSPSRASLLTGRRPDTTQVYGSSNEFRSSVGSISTLPQYFKDRHGYHTVGMGKIFHPGHDDEQFSWTNGSYYHSENLRRWSRDNASWIAVDPQSERKPLPDDDLLAKAFQELDNVKNNNLEPFFMAVGFYKPHLPFVFPQEYLMDYPENEVVLADNPYVPTGFPEEAWFNFAELRNYQDISALASQGYDGSFNTSLPDSKALELRRAYYSTVSYVDSLFGKLMDKLDQVGLANDTIVVFIGDHGWQLGDHATWCKNTVFEVSLRTPYIMRVPGLTDNGFTTDKLVEFVDIFPTLVDLSGVEDASYSRCPTEADRTTFACHEGVSLKYLIENPDAAWKTAAFSQQAATFNGNTPAMGYSVRTDKYRFNQWVKFNKKLSRPDFSRVFAEELYDHIKDPAENKNVIDDINYKEIVEELRKVLNDGWRKALPDESNRTTLSPSTASKIFQQTSYMYLIIIILCNSI